jgi:hypothetical protein
LRQQQSVECLLDQEHDIQLEQIDLLQEFLRFFAGDPSPQDLFSREFKSLAYPELPFSCIGEIEKFVLKIRIPIERGLSKSPGLIDTCERGLVLLQGG